MPTAIAEHPPTVADVRDSSPYAIAQGGMAGLIDAAVQTRRLEAMQAAMRVDVINLAVDYAIRSADAFTAQSLSPGFDADRLVTASMDMFPSGYSGERYRDFQRRVLESVRALPGVESAAAINEVAAIASAACATGTPQ